MKEFRLEQIEAIPASGVDVNPSGNLGSSDVQAALLELQADIDAIGGASVGGYSMIWAEENGSLSTGGGSLGNGEQFSWGNGGTQNQLPIGFDCTVTYLVIESYSSTTATVTLYKNGVSTDASVSLSSGTLGTAVVNVAVNQGDTLVFRTTSGSGGTAVVVGAVLRSGAVGDELVNDVSPQLGGNLDMNGFTIAGATEAELALLDLGTQTVVANEVLVGTGAGTAAWQQLAANQVTVTPSDNLTSTDIQSALTELQGDIDTINSAGYLTDITGEALIDLSDTPANYTTHANKFLRVNSTPNAVEFVAASAINLSDFNDDLSYISAANLAIANKTATNLDITIDVGTNATVPAATAIEAGLMIATDKSKLDGIESGAKDDQNASEVPVTPIGNLTSTDVQAALAELQGDIDTINAAGYLTDITGESFVDLNDTPANYAGASNYLVSVNSTPNALEFIAKSSINLSDFNDDLTYIGAANLSLGTHNANTLGVLIDAGTDITLPAATTSLSGLLTGSDKTKLDGIEANAKDDQVASQVPVTPTGNLVATDVQAALNELQGDIDGINALGYLQNVVEDTTPQLGGDLDAQSNAITNVDHLTFDTDAGYSVGVGELAWNADEDTLDLGQNGAVLQVGQEIHYHVRNNSGSNIGEGVAVMATGTLGASGRITIDEFNNDGSISPEYFMGITTESIDNNADGKVTHFGKVRGIDTSGTPYGETWSDGDLVYVDATTLGALTNVQPTAPSMKIAIAIVIHAHASAGTLFVRAALNQGVHDLHDTDLTGLADGNILTYKPSNQTWINQTFSAAGISEVGHGHAANEITVTPVGNLASTDVQAAFQELQGDIDTINGAGYLTEVTIDGSGYQAIDLVNYATWNSSGTLYVHNGFIVDSSTFNNTGGFGLTYADVLGKIHIPGTPTSNHIITLPAQTFPASDDYEFWIKGVEDSGFKYSLNALGIDFINLYTGASVTTLDLLDSKIYHVWYDYSANDFYYYVIEESSAGTASPLTTKGDLYTYDTADARLGVGADDSILIADSSEAVGMRWAATAIGELDFAKRSSTSTQSITSTAAAIPWQTELDVGVTITWSSGNNTRLTVSETGSYRLGAYITVNSSAFRDQHVVEVYINGVASGILRSSTYVRNSTTSWDYWVMEVATEPFRLTANDYVELYIGTVTGGSYTYGPNGTGTLVGDKSAIWMERATTGRGPTGPTGPSGADGGDEKLDGVFRIQNTADDTKEISFDASGIATGTTREITMPNTDVDLGDIATNTSNIAAINSYGSFVNSTTTWTGSCKSRIDGADIVQVLGEMTATASATAAVLPVAHRPSVYTTRGVWNETTNTMIECFIQTDGGLDFNGVDFTSGDTIRFDFHFEK